MGQAINCNTCCSDSKPEVEFRNSISFAVKTTPHTEVVTQDATEPAITIHEAKGGPKIELEVATVKIQSLWKALVVRRQLRRLVRHLVQNHDYFSREEVIETLSNKRKLATAHAIMPPYRYANGAVYSGQWLGGFRDGWGTIVYSSGAKYEGYWSFSRPYGEGTFTYPSGESYKGRWGNPLNQGQVSMCKTGEGWRDAVKDGYEWLWYMEEVLKSPDLDEQKRRVRENIKKAERRIVSICESVERLETYKKGRGREQAEIIDGDLKYTGEVLEGVKDGFGRQVWKNGDYFEGQWKDNTQHGWGRNVWEDGSVFIGTFKYDNKDGVGEYTWEDGTRYLGEWKDNMMHGYGKYTWPDGRMFEGEWRAGLMQGYGIYSYSDGKRYEGGWFQGKKHGVGSTYFPDGRFTKVIWKAGKVDTTANK